MAAAEETEENHWPGFVDALSTIVMVVTFLLIILAIVIFALSLNIAKVVAVAPTDAAPTMDTSKTVLVEYDPVVTELSSSATLLRKSQERVVLKFEGTTLAIDDSAREEVVTFFAERPELMTNDADLAIIGYYDASKDGYTKLQRMGYYRVMAVRNILISQGFSGDRVNVFVREATRDAQIDTVEIARRG